MSLSRLDLRLAACCLCAALLTGCGIKGPLFLPAPRPAATAPATPSAPPVPDGSKPEPSTRTPQ